MKKTVSAIISLAAAFSLAAPAAALAAERDTAGSKTKAQEGGTGSTSGSTGAGTAETAAKAPSKKLQEGLEKLHAGNQAEVQGGQMAQKTATSSDVKSFGEKMVTDHTQMDQQLASIAQTLGVSLQGKAFEKETRDGQRQMSGVEKKTGVEFDKAYMKAMVQDHQKDAKEVKKLADEARKDGHADLASFLDQAEQTMQGHLTMAKEIEQKVKNEKKSTAASSSSSTGSGGASSK